MLQGWRQSPKTKALLAFAFFFFVIVSTITGYSIWRWPSWKASKDAHQALSEARFADAFRITKRWLQSHPNEAEAHFLRAKAAIPLGNRAEILDGMNRAIALKHPENDILQIRALLEAQAGRYDLAKPTLLQAFHDLKAPDPILYEALSRVLMETYNWPEADKVLVRWGNDFPKDPRPPLWHAVVNLRRGAEPADTITDYRESLRRDPEQPEALLGLADELARQFKHEESISLYQKYVNLRPDDPTGHLGVGKAAVGLGNLGLAGREFDRALELAPENAIAHKERAKIDLQTGDLNNALKHLDQSIKVQPYDPTVRYSRKMTLTRLGKNVEAAAEQKAIDDLKADIARVENWQKSLENRPKDENLQYQIAKWMFEHSYDAEGLKWSKKILFDHPNHLPTRLLLADYYDRSGDTATANQYRSRPR
jgi:tetratricopeptide (TPR) repeat protein